MTWIIALSLMGLATVFFSVQFNKRFEESMPAITFSVILTLFLFGIINQLKTGFWFVVAGCALLSVSGIVLAIFRKKIADAARNLFTPAFCIFAFLTLAIWYYNSGMMLIGWDEFSHWGQVVKAMVMSDQLSTYSNIDLTFRSYPPALSLFQYFLISIRGTWEEADLFRGNGILAITLFLPFLKNIQWKNPATIISSILLIILTPMLFYSNFYSSIYVDTILAVFFGYCLAEAYLYEKGNLFSLVRVSLGLSVLAILKESGQALSIIACIVLISKAIYLDFKDSPESKKNPTVNPSGILRRIVILLRRIIYRMRFSLLLAIPILTSALWKLNMTLTNTTRAFSGSIDLNMLKAILERTTDNYRLTVYNNFLSTLALGSLTPGFFTGSFYFWAAVLSLLLYTLYYLNKKDLRFAKYANVITIVGLVLFTAGILITYLFSFSEYEASILASFQRYVSTYPQGIFACIVMILLFCSYSPKQDKPDRMAIMKLILVAFLSIFIPMTSLSNITTGLSRKDSVKMRERFSDIVSKVDASDIQPGDKIWLIAEHTDGFEYWILKYEFIEQYFKEGAYWSLGDKFSDADVWTANITVEEWEGQLLDYDYVLTYSVNQVFIDKYQSLFESPDQIGNNSIYKIIKDGSEVTLKHVSQ